MKRIISALSIVAAMGLVGCGQAPEADQGGENQEQKLVTAAGENFVVTSERTRDGIITMLTEQRPTRVLAWLEWRRADDGIEIGLPIQRYEGRIPAEHDEEVRARLKEHTLISHNHAVVDLWHRMNQELDARNEQPDRL